MKALMKLVGGILSLFGNTFGYLYLKYDYFFLYKCHSWCMMVAYEIRKHYRF